MTTLSFTHRFVPGDSPATLLLLHGTGGDENDLLPLGRELAPSANLLSPRGPVLEQGQPRFFRRLAVGVFDEEDLARRAGDLATFVKEASRAYPLDPSRIYALGYSNGANMAAALLLLHGELLSGAVLLRAVLPLEPPRLPALDGKPALIAAGTADPYAPRERVEALAERLAQAGAAVDLRWHEGGHGLDPPEVPTLRAWVERHVK